MKTKGWGFTLIEALVVISVLSILAGALVPLALKNIEDAKLSSASEDLGSIAKAIAARTRTCSRCGVEFFETEYSNESLCARCSIEAVREITRKNLSDALLDQQRIWSFLEEHPGAVEDEIWKGIGGARKTILKRMVEGGLVIEYRADESSPWKYRCEPAFFDYLACSSCGTSLSGSGPGDFLVSRDGAPVCKNCVLDKGWVFC